jgi:hypothetical protein
VPHLVFMQMSGFEPDATVSGFLQHADADFVMRWLEETDALKCWCEKDRVDRLQLSRADHEHLEAERNSLLAIMTSGKPSSEGMQQQPFGGDAVMTLKLQVKALEVTARSTANGTIV